MNDDWKKELHDLVAMQPQKFEVINTLHMMLQTKNPIGICNWMDDCMPTMADLVGIKLQCERILGKNFSLTMRLSSNGKNINLCIEER